MSTRRPTRTDRGCATSTKSAARSSTSSRPGAAGIRIPGPTFYRWGDRIGSKSFPKSCSQQLKISVIYRFLEELLAHDYGVSFGSKRGFHEYTALIGEKITVMIGLSAEEAGRRLSKNDKASKWMRETVERVYPLTYRVGLYAP